MSPTTIRFCCPTSCDPDCDAVCHEIHLPEWKRDHNPRLCLAQLNGATNDGSGSDSQVKRQPDNRDDERDTPND